MDSRQLVEGSNREPARRFADRGFFGAGGVAGDPEGADALTRVFNACYC